MIYFYSDKKIFNSFFLIVTAAWYEPVPGWTSSKNGPTGFIMGAAKGVVRRLPANKDLIYDYIPVDVVVNNMIVAAYKTGTFRYNYLIIINSYFITKK